MQTPLHKKHLMAFAGFLIFIQVMVIIFYGIFVRYINDGANRNQQFYPMYQDVNVMMLIGFGFLMTFVRTGAWQALTYTFFINSVVVQLHILFAHMWERIFHGGQDQFFISQVNLTGASYCVASVLIAFGVLLGRVGPLHLLVLGVIQTIAYTLNEQIVYELIKVYDFGGSTAIHVFGAYFGLAASFIIGRGYNKQDLPSPSSSYISNTFAVLGTFFLWMFWPSFNAGFFADTGFERTIVVINTVLSLTASCIGTFITTSFIRHKLNMEDILNASLAGGVAIGASSSLFVNPAASLTVGLTAGVISSLGFRYLTERLAKIGIYDTAGVHNLHGIPGLFGGIISSIAIASYQSSGTAQNDQNRALLEFITDIFSNRSFSEQAGLQIAATFCSMGIGLLFGIIAGFALKFIPGFKNEKQFYDDAAFFDDLDDEHTKMIPTMPPQSTSMIINSEKRLQS